MSERSYILSNQAVVKIDAIRKPGLAIRIFNRVNEKYDAFIDFLFRFTY
jgi:hypothetical protein